MMWHIFNFEWIQMRKSWSFRFTAMLVPLLIGYSLYLGHIRVQEQLHNVQQLLQLEEAFYTEMANRQQLIEQGQETTQNWFQDPSNPIVLAQFGDAGRFVILHPKPLAALAAGQSDLLPYYGKVTLTGRNVMRDNALGNPVLQATGQFDFAFVLVWLIPLFVIVMGFDVLSREKESGTFALLKAQPVSILKILLHKVMFRYLVISAIVGVSVLIAALVMGIPFFSLGGLHVAAAVLAYIAFWFMLCILVNLKSDRSAVNAIILAGSWVFFVLVLPSIIMQYAANRHPVPSRAMWVTEQRAIEQSVNADRDAYYESWKADHPEEVLDGETPAFYQIWMQRLVTQQIMQERLDPARERFDKPLVDQANLIARLRMVSPPLMIHHWLQQQAGTDAARLRTLDRLLHESQQEWQSTFIPRFRQLHFFTAEEIRAIRAAGL